MKEKKSKQPKLPKGCFMRGGRIYRRYFHTDETRIFWILAILSLILTPFIGDLTEISHLWIVTLGIGVIVGIYAYKNSWYEAEERGAEVVGGGIDEVMAKRAGDAMRAKDPEARLAAKKPEVLATREDW